MRVPELSEEASEGPRKARRVEARDAAGKKEAFCYEDEDMSMCTRSVACDLSCGMLWLRTVLRNEYGLRTACGGCGNLGGRTWISEMSS